MSYLRLIRTIAIRLNNVRKPGILLAQFLLVDCITTVRLMPEVNLYMFRMEGRMKQAKIIVIALMGIILMCAGCVSTAEKPAQSAEKPAEPALPPADIQPPAIKVNAELGQVLTGEFSGDVSDIYYEYTVEIGSTYDIYVVDGYNNGQNLDMQIDGPAKAVGFWILRSDAKTTYPQSVYVETDEDSKSGYGFIGFTLDKAPGPVATIKAQDSLLFVHVQRYKASYTGKFMVKVVKK